MKRQFSRRRGAMLVLVAASLIVLIVGVVFSVDVAYMHMIRAELRTATDAAARAGSEVLARTQDAAQARAAALAIAERNQVAGNGLTLLPNDVEFGSLGPSSGRFTFHPNVAPFTAVRVTGRRDNSAADGAVSLFFAKVFSTTKFEPVQVATASSNVRDVALVLDVSGSMAIPSGSGTRLSALQTAVGIFVDEIEATSPNTLLSLISYNGSPKKVLDLTNNLTSIRNAIDRFTAGGTTGIGNALTMGSDSLVLDSRNRDFAFKSVIVMTDGNHNTGPSPATTVATAVARGQQVHAITFSSEANQALMQTVVRATNGGIHIHADSASDLAAAFRAIARTLSVTLVE